MNLNPDEPPLSIWTAVIIMIVIAVITITLKWLQTKDERQNIITPTQTPDLINDITYKPNKPIFTIGESKHTEELAKIDREVVTREIIRTLPTSDIEQTMQNLCTEMFGEEHWQPLRNLVMRESGFNPTAQNPTTTAYGLFQFLDSTWAGTGIEKTDDPLDQMEAGFIYIRNRYVNPTGAWEYFMKNNWY